MSNVSAVISYIKGKVESIDTPPASSRHAYDFGSNDGAKNSFIFAVRPGSSSKVDGAIGRATFLQNFAVEIAKEFKESTVNDEGIQNAVEAIHAAGESLMKLLVGKPSGHVLNIETPDFNDPQIDHGKKSVSITYTFPVKYFVPIRGVLT